jgi:hypothetical protein
MLLADNAAPNFVCLLQWVSGQSCRHMKAGSLSASSAPLLMRLLSAFTSKDTFALLRVALRACHQLPVPLLLAPPSAVLCLQGSQKN